MNKCFVQVEKILEVKYIIMEVFSMIKMGNYSRFNFWSPLFWPFTTLVPRLVLLMMFLAFPLFTLANDLPNPIYQSWGAHQALKQSTPFRFHWVHLGPVMNSARVEAVQAHPARPGTMYVAFGSGNLWKTTDNGLTWKPIFENQPVLGIGDIAVAPSNPDVIWLGSGESLKKARNFTMPGMGVFRSDNGGESWQYLGLPDSYHIGEIAVHPQNPDVALVAVLGHFWTPNPNRGVYRTEDGGRTWEHVLYVDEHTGANDVVISPSNPNIIYASLWENYPSIAGPQSGVYKSNDGGKTWQRLSGGLPTGPRTGRIGLAVSWTNPDKVYALIDNLNRPGNLAAEVYRSDDGGQTWHRTHQEDLLIFPGIGWYFTDIYVNPQDDDEIFALGVRIAHSQDGGKTFSLVGGKIFHLFPNPAECLHLDHCELWVDWENPRHLILGNDGGLYVSWDRGKSWLHHNNIPAGEFYDISVDNEDPYHVYGGTQDDAAVYGPAKEWDPRFPDGWTYLWLDAWAGGDGCFTIPDPEDPHTVYFSSQHGGIRRKDMSSGRSISIRPRWPEGKENALRFTFVAPYLISPHNHLILYLGGNYVFRSLNRGDKWEVISPDLSRSRLANKMSTALGALAESPLKPGLIYAGTDKGAFWVTKNGGVTWEEHSAGLPNRYIHSICASRFKESRVYVVVTGINDDDFNAYLYASEDYGQTWRSIKSNLPQEVAYVLLEDPTNENILYAGMYRGVYVSVDRGQSWSYLGQGMPDACISDLVIQEREMDLVAATHGRGIYKLNLRPIQAAFQGLKNEDIKNKSLLKKRWVDKKLFVPPPGKLPQFGDTHREPLYKTLERIPFTFIWNKEEEVELAVVNGQGQKLWSTKIKAQPGFNQFRWDMVIKHVQSMQAYFIHYDRFIPPGKYKILLEGEGTKLSQEWEVKPSNFYPRYFER